MKTKGYAAYIAIAVIVALMLIFGQQKSRQEKEEAAETASNNAGSGFLEIQTSPKDADVFVDGINKGKSPITISNVAAGTHEVLIKKEGYGEFLKAAEVSAGRRTSIEADLIRNAALEEAAQEEPEAVKEDAKSETGAEEQARIINDTIKLGKTFLKYYDFSERKFGDVRPEDYDTFSKRFNDHLTFTRYNPAKIKAIRKNIADIAKRDCEGINGELEYLHSGESLCVITKEGLVAVIGGSWQGNTENAELNWKVFS